MNYYLHVIPKDARQFLNLSYLLAKANPILNNLYEEGKMTECAGYQTEFFSPRPFYKHIVAIRTKSQLIKYDHSTQQRNP